MGLEAHQKPSRSKPLPPVSFEKLVEKLRPQHLPTTSNTPQPPETVLEEKIPNSITSIVLYRSQGLIDLSLQMRVDKSLNDAQKAFLAVKDRLIRELNEEIKRRKKI